MGREMMGRKPLIWFDFAFGMAMGALQANFVLGS